MVPVSLYLGFASAIIWVEQVHTSLYRISDFFVAKARILFLTLLWVHQGTYLTAAARSHARDNGLHEGTIIGNFNGEFWGMFACRQVNPFALLFMNLCYIVNQDLAFHFVL